MERFADETVIEVSSGNGGNGCVAFRREAHVPRGGPSGGDGGRGGDVVFEVRRNLRTLAGLRFKRNFKAENGRDGMGSRKHGRDGADAVIAVPPGTIVKDDETGEVLKDFGEEEGRWTFLKGGNGGWGNDRFKSSTNQAPRYAQPGQTGRAVVLKLELSIIADVGLVGFPNAGKTSILDRFTNARAKVAPYPFTTKIPNLGVLRSGDRDVIIADIPGIIEGASSGAGLGLKFLKHISRTRGLAFLVDLGDESFLGAFDVLLAELRAYAPELTGKRRIIVGTKLDLPDTGQRLAALSEKYGDERVFGVSVFSGEGLDSLQAELLAFEDR
jgi:GTP-binding protein